jgi:hypothetical protein
MAGIDSSAPQFRKLEVTTFLKRRPLNMEQVEQARYKRGGDRRREDERS